MELMLLPNVPARKTSQVPYVGRERYDGGDWLSYPLRVGRTHMLPDPNDSASVPYRIYENTYPTPTKEQESFFQTWLFFGLISEALGGNSVTDKSSTPHTEIQAASQILSSIYEIFVIEVDKQSYVSTESFWSKLQASWTPSLFNNREVLLRRSKHLSKCLHLAHDFYRLFPKDFDPRIWFSIGAIGEMLANSMHVAALLLKTEEKEDCPTEWSLGFLRSESKDGEFEGIRTAMLRLGWCPSDLARCENKFFSLQTLHFMSVLDRSKPTRDHKDCDEVQCKAYQIDKNSYYIGHFDSNCTCKMIEVDHDKIMKVLNKGDRVPLLRFVGDKDNLKIEVVESGPHTTYVALSHVWADGLGNPEANALYACQLVRLQKLMDAIGTNTTTGSLVWIDTLCCPVRPPKAKKLSLSKMQEVYQRATSVLVLDASLSIYDSRSMDVVEKLARIFTSGWLRRLWTLQEGALAEHLYFQFSDCAISLDDLRQELALSANDLRRRIFLLDIMKEWGRIQRFFHADRISMPGPDLDLLDSSLLHRGVTDPSDEAICIATLMSLPRNSILFTKVEYQMKTVWKYLAQKYGGIPSQIIFLEDRRLTNPGWRWAPASLLYAKPQLHKPITRMIRWHDTKLGKPTPRGLQVEYPGFYIAPKMYEDNMPRQPWIGTRRPSESRIVFRDVDTGQWWQVAEKEYAYKLGNRGQEDNEVVILDKYPLHDLVHSRGCYLITREVEDNADSNPGPSEGIIVTALNDNSWFAYVRVLLFFFFFWQLPEGLPVISRTHVIAAPLNTIEADLFNTVELLALQLREDPLTLKMVSILDSSSHEYKDLLVELEQRMKSLMATELQKNQTLNDGVKLLWGENINESLWVLIGDYFNHNFLGVKLPANYIWVVD